MAVQESHGVSQNFTPSKEEIWTHRLASYSASLCAKNRLAMSRKALTMMTGLMGLWAVIRSSHLATFKSPSSSPREGCSYTFEEASKPVSDRFPNAKGREKGLTVIRVSLAGEACVTASGPGIPPANADDAQVEGWVNQNKPIINNLTLLDVLQQRIFYIAIAYPLTYTQNKLSEDLLESPFSYPYGTEQRWNVDDFKDLADLKGLTEANKSNQFEP